MTRLLLRLGYIAILSRKGPDLLRRAELNVPGRRIIQDQVVDKVLTCIA